MNRMMRRAAALVAALGMLSSEASAVAVSSPMIAATEMPALNSVLLKNSGAIKDAEKELRIPVKELNMGEFVVITLYGQPGQEFNGEFDNITEEDQFNAPSEAIEEDGKYKFTFTAPFDMDAFVFKVSYSGPDITYDLAYNLENNEYNLSVPVTDLKRNETVHVTLYGQAGQEFTPSFDFSEQDVEMGAAKLIPSKPMKLNEDGEFVFSFKAPWAMDPFAFNVLHQNSPITYFIEYERQGEPSTEPTETEPTETTTEAPTEPQTEPPTDPPTEPPREDPTEAKRFVDGEDNWSFSNSDDNFTHGYYYINSEDEKKLLDGLTYSEQEAVLDLLNSYWGGSCYGLAASSILAANNIYSPNTIYSGAEHLHDIPGPPSDKIQSFINYHFAMQVTDYVQQKVCENFYEEDEGKKIKQLLDCLEDGSPTLLCYHGYFYLWSWGGHAVVAYGVENGSYKYDGHTYDTRIVTYDNNAVKFNADYCLYIDTKTNQWTLPAYELNTSYGSILGLISDDMDIVNYHSYFREDAGKTNSTGSYISVLKSLDLGDDCSIKKVAIDDGNWSINSSGEEEDEIKRFSSFDASNYQSSEEAPKTMEFALKDSSSGYLTHVTEPREQKMSIRYPDSMLKAEASNSDAVIFDPSGFIQVTGEDTNYILSMILNEDEDGRNWHKISVAGVNADTMTIEKTDDVAGGVILSADCFQNVSVSIVGEADVPVVTFSTDSKKVLVTESAASPALEIREDSNGDGTFDAVVSTFTLGDIDADATINAQDAAKILVEAANLGAGGDSTFDETQQSAADVNGDTKFDASDAASILQYAAYLGSGGSQFLQEFLNSIQ